MNPLPHNGICLTELTRGIDGYDLDVGFLKG